MIKRKQCKMLFIKTENFKCEDCEGDKFTMHELRGSDRITLFCATKDCEASYDFRPEMKLSSSSHPTKICKCGKGFLSRIDKFCSGCGIKNPGFKEMINDEDLEEDDEIDELLLKSLKGGKGNRKNDTNRKQKQKS